MRQEAPTKLQKNDMVHTVANVVTFNGPIRRFGLWLERKLKIDLYELRGDEIVALRGQVKPFKVCDLSTWRQVFIDFGMSVIVIKFTDGHTIELRDKHQHLIGILQKVAPEKELPWTAN